MSQILSQSFIDSYRNATAPFGFNGLGYVVYKRCVTIDTPILAADLQWIKAGEIEVGREIVGFEEGPLKRGEKLGRPRRIEKSFITHNVIEDADCVEIELENGKLLYSTPDHQWLAYTGYGMEWIEAKDLIHDNHLKPDEKIHYSLPKYSDVWETDTSYEGGYLAAAFDGEGSLDGRSTLAFVQRNNEMLETVCAFLDKYGFRYNVALKAEGLNGNGQSFKAAEPCFQVSIYSNEQVARFLGMFRPKRLLRVYQESFESISLRRKDRGDLYHKVIRVTPVGKRKIAVISTSSKTHITAGYPSHNTYSRVKDDGTNEEWYETVARCVNGAQKIGAGYTREEAERLYDHVFNLRCNFAGRMLWQLGTSTVERFAANSLLNCWFRTINEPRAFLFLFENLMLGGGVGFSVRREDVHELPRVKKGVTITHQLTKDADFIVPDSRQGWVKLLSKVLDAYYVTGKSFTYSTILVRGSGEKINGFGGTASGPTILIDGMQKIAAILKSREEKKLRSIDALDICNVIGSIVVAGNVRRSAEIALGDPDDYLYLRAKNWSLGNVPNHRAMSNNTIYADSFDHISDEIWNNGYALDPVTGHAKGEPYGFFNLPLSQRFGRIKDGPMKDSDIYPTDRDNCVGVNPCQPAWAPILTENGLTTMGALKEGDRIWSETGWTTVAKKWSTGVKPVYRYQTTAGVFFGTENHRVVSHGEKVEAQYAESIDRLSGPYVRHLTVDPQDVMDGIVFGDGSVHQASNDLVHLCIGKDDADYHHSEVGRLIREYRPGLHDYAWEVITTIDAEELPLTFNRSIPDRFIYAAPHKVAGFLRGLYTANGSIVADRITLKASSFKVIEQVQLMLSSLGIASYYTTNRPTRVQFSNGEYLCKESYDLNITRDRATFAALIGFIQLYKVEKVDRLLKEGRKATKSPKIAYDVASVTKVSEEEVFDITVDNAPHTYWTGGLNVSNCAEVTLASSESCNLSELYLNNITSKEQLIDCATLIYKTQKAIAAMPFLHEETNEIVHRNMRLGLGVTGVCQSIEKLDWLDECYVALRAFDAEWSKQRGWPRSIKLTTVKPSGSLSLLAGSTPGVHPAMFPFYIRRVRMGSGDALVKQCRDAGYHVEYARDFDGKEKRDTVVVEFPCRTPDGAILAKDMPVLKQLDMVAKLQSVWSDNAVSVTAYYEPEELPALKAWLKENYEKKVKSVSFLLRDRHGFQQAPYEEITRERYEQLVAKITPLVRVVGGVLEGIECAGGACPVR